MAGRRDGLFAQHFVTDGALHGLGAVFLAGGINHNGFLGVVSQRQSLLVQHFAALSTLHNLGAGNGTGGLGDLGLTLGVGQLPDRLGVGMGLVVLTGKGLHALSGTGGLEGDSFLVVMLQRRDGFFLGLTAVVGTGVDDLTGLGTGGLGGHAIRPDMLVGRGFVFGLDVLVVVLTGVGTHADLGAGGQSGHNTLVPLVADRVHKVLLDDLLTHGTDDGGGALLLTGGSHSYRRTLGMADSLDHFNGGLGTAFVGTGAGQLTGLSTGSRLGHGTLIELMLAGCIDDLGLGLFTQAAGVGQHTGLDTGGLGGDDANVPLMVALGFRNNDSGVAGDGDGHLVEVRIVGRVGRHSNVIGTGSNAVLHLQDDGAQGAGKGLNGIRRLADEVRVQLVRCRAIDAGRQAGADKLEHGRAGLNLHAGAGSTAGVAGNADGNGNRLAGLLFNSQRSTSHAQKHQAQQKRKNFLHRIASIHSQRLLPKNTIR